MECIHIYICGPEESFLSLLNTFFYVYKKQKKLTHSLNWAREVFQFQQNPIWPHNAFFSPPKATLCAWISLQLHFQV